MKVEFRRKFLKELAKVPTKTQTKIEFFVFTTLPAIKTLSAVGNIEAMRGYHGYYKVRFGSYRIGLKLEGETIIREKVLHRKEIYRYFS